MARPHRLEYEDAYYHVMNRGRGRRFIFHSDTYYTQFLNCLEQAHVRFDLEIHAYCLMGNHYHLLVKTPRGNLSRAMRHINGVYTQHYNRLKKTDGPLFRGRYKAINIQASSYLTEVSRYIHRNPIEMKAPLVNRLIDYPWSSYPAYLNKANAPEWLTRKDVYNEVTGSPPSSSYKRFVEFGNDEETEQFYQKQHWPAVRGDKAFSNKALKHANTSSAEVSRKYTRKTIGINQIIKAVADYYQCPRSKLTKVTRGRYSQNIARSIAMKLSQEHSGKTQPVIAKHFGLKHYSSVSRSIAQLNRVMEQNSVVESEFNSINQDLTP